MQGCNQGRQLFLWNVLDFINEQRQSRASLGSRPARCLQQGLQVQCQIAIVRKPRFRIQIQAHLNIVVFDS